ncbi:MAG: UDP-3-O-(3-hydroxymyristoyl)glucosamine N-acyltransferase [Rhodospirillales bacterium]|nr:UDP-3-O-(3-hydroxymyristoyl)glucosamine N-acyltransferase [Rhodospirillales bacterium]
MKLSDIAEKLGCALRGDGNTEITGVSGIKEAGPGQLTFVANPRYASEARTTRAGAVIVGPKFAELRAPTLRAQDPYLTFARAIELFYTAPRIPPGIDPLAHVSPRARIGPDPCIGPFVVIEDDTEIGRHCVIYPFVYIGPEVRIGSHFRAYAHVSVREHSRIGDHVTLYDGARVGTDGFGYAKQADGSYYKIAQSGSVVLEDGVEIGANATVDRATVGETRIRRGVKIDNLVQVGHASDIGENSILCAQVGLAGSTRIGRNCVMAGQVGIAGHLEIGDGVVAAAQSGIPNSVEPGQRIAGSPAFESRAWLKTCAVMKRLPELLKRIETLERALGEKR